MRFKQVQRLIFQRKKYFGVRCTVMYNRILGKNIALTLDLADDVLLCSTIFNCSSVSAGFSWSFSS